MSNSLGKLFRITSFGESHGKIVGVVIDGVPAGLKFDLEKIQKEVDKRRPGSTSISTPRSEKDKVEVLSGVFNGYTTGAPLCMIVKNMDTRSEDYEKIKDTPRPGHADYTANIKYGGFNDYRGGGRFSGRITAGYVMAGAVAKLILEKKNINVVAYTSKIGSIQIGDINIPIEKIKEQKEENPVLCPDSEAADKMVKLIKKVQSEKDSIGGIITCQVSGVPPGVGEPVFSSVESEISKAIFSIPGVKGIEFGVGFRAAQLRGSENNDEFTVKNGKITLKTNNSGGILGGITTGERIIFNVAMKPTSSIARSQETVNVKTKKITTIEIPGRHDPCIVPRAVPVVESITAVVLVDLLMQGGFIEHVFYAEKEDIAYQRRVIDDITLKMVSLLKSRLDAAEIIGKVKRKLGKRIVDASRERELINKAEAYAKEIRLPEEKAVKLVSFLIEESVKTQKKDKHN